MQDYKDHELSELFDVLAQKTAHYMKMLSGGATKDAFDSCRESIIEIQLEIQSRRLKKANSSSTNPDISVSEKKTTSDQRKN